MKIEIKNYGWLDSSVEFEATYEAKSGAKVILPLSSTWKGLLIQVSGGLDSALLLYLTAKTIKERNLDLEIQPLSIEVPTKAKTLTTARAVIAKVTELLDFKNMRPGAEFHVPVDEAVNPNKDRFFERTVLQFIKSGEVQFEYNGNTKNPPYEVRRHFSFDEDGREKGRDARTTIYNGIESASPHAMVDKQDIISLYKRYDLLEELAPLTLSCDENMENIIKYNMSIPCGKCWWCQERAWGFEALNDQE